MPDTSPPNRPIWEIDQATYYSSKRKELLAAGWEPFAVVSRTLDDLIFFRWVKR